MTAQSLAALKDPSNDAILLRGFEVVVAHESLLSLFLTYFFAPIF